MHRALGGAPVSRVLPLSLRGRRLRWAAALAGCLRAFAVRVRRGLPLYNKKKIHGRGMRPRFSQLLHLKNKFFLGKKLVRSALSYAKNYKDGAMPRLLRAELESGQKSKFCPHPKFAFFKTKP
jgi:hypothetical protein